MLRKGLKKPTKTAPLESEEQRALVKWLGYHPIVRNCFLKLNNEGKRHPISGQQLKLMGLKPGAADLFIFYPTRTYHGLWLEVKRNKKYTASEMTTDTWLAQIKFLETVKKLGYEGKTCYGWQDGVAIIEKYLLT